ncbi:MAG: SH3 domain-containing protein [Spirosomataceae bacterium]
MKKTQVFIVFLLMSHNLFAQSLKGVWKGLISSDPNSSMIYYNLISEGKVLNLSLENESIVNIGISLIGFSDIIKDTISPSELKDKGDFLCICNKLNNDSLECIFPSFNLRDSSYFTSGTDVFDYQKIDLLPVNVLKQLFKGWGFVNRDLFFMFTNKKIVTLNSKSSIYQTPNKPTKMYLLKNDPVEVIEEKDNWLKIIYYPEKNGEWTGKTIEGWIKRSDVE